MTDSLDLFHPLVAKWFRERVGTPTEAQAAAWPAIARGEHVLVTAPTGSGKTLAAFLWALDRLITGKWEGGRTRVLYVSPLKALNNDIQRNLLAPLAGLEEAFRSAGESFPEIRVETRSGDTPQSVRQRMLRRPPEILITTPESLNLMLSSKSGRAVLDSLATAILDEIHTVVANKRGVHLITAVERLVPLSGEFQRITMSATVKPIAAVAEFVGGFRLEPEGAWTRAADGAAARGGPAVGARSWGSSSAGTASQADLRARGGPRFIPRPVTIIHSGENKAYDLKVVRPEDRPEGAADRSEEDFWPPLVREFHRIIERNRSSLFFVRSRRQSESLAFRINAGEPSPLAYSHHGSLSKELRLDVETRLKSGDLKAIVATNSLELGIDIGALDEVVLVQSPPSISSAVQRVGRAGHQVGAISRGSFFPTYDQDIVESAVIVRAIREGDIEETCPIENALDVLAQVLLSMLGTETWDIDALYDRIRTSRPYRSLSRTQFDLVLQMLAGRYAHTRIRELKPRISVDRIDNTAVARPGALLSLFLSGGTIPDRGYFHLRHEETGALIGELDEEFVWEATPGQNFAFGAQYWTIRRITHNEVFALPVRLKSAEAPFWKGEVFNRNSYLSDKIAAFMDEADRRLDDPAWRTELEQNYCLDEGAVEHLVDYLKRQKLETGAALPGSGRIIAEHVQAGPDGYPGNQIILHTLWGGQVNRPFALALDAGWEERHGYRLEIFTGDDSIVLQLPHDVSGNELIGLVNEGNLEVLLRKRLESSGYFGARFRENAGRALLLVRRRANERMPLWMSRLRSQKLLQAAMGLPDFPVLLETWRTCLRDEFDLEALKRKLEGVAAGSIGIRECVTTRPSPLARKMTWGQLNQYMYAGDELPSDRRSRLRGELIREVVLAPWLRPPVSAETVRRFEEKRQRLSPGYAPAPDRDLVDWLKERVVLPWPEWEKLMQAVARDRAAEEAAGESEDDEGRLAAKHETGSADQGGAKGQSAEGVGRSKAGGKLELAPEAASRLVRITVSGAVNPFACALERLPEVLKAFWPGRDAVVKTVAGENVDPKLIEAAYSASKPADEEPDALLTSLAGEWLQSYGPMRPEDIGGALVLDAGRLNLALEDMKDSETVIEGVLVKGSEAAFVCDAENFEVLLRMERAALAPSVEVREIDKFPLFLAQVQGVVQATRARAETEEEKTFRAIEQLVGYSLPAHLWEAEVLPARVPDYTVARLDFALGQSDLRWQGSGGREIRFLFEQNIDLVHGENGSDENRESEDEAGEEGKAGEEAGKKSDEQKGQYQEENPKAAGPRVAKAAANLFTDPHARYDFGTLLNRTGGDIAALEERLWEGVWAGELTNSTWSAVRRGLQTKFRVGEVIEGQKRSLEYVPRRESLRLSAWRESRAYPGNWFLLPKPSTLGEDELIEREEVRKDRVRVLLDRYGILFRELLAREKAPFRWSDLFRTLRLMELSGEVLAGYFFKSVPGPQFISHSAFRAFQQELPEEAVFWLSAVDPASACGLPLKGLRGALPKRVEGTHLVYRGSQLVVVSQRSGRNLNIMAPPDDERLPEYLEFLRHLLTREYAPLRRIIIETINGEPAPQSPYLPAFRQLLDVVVDIKRVSLFRRVQR
jgi:ATP-dependent Lhr-like helicase